MTDLNLDNRELNAPGQNPEFETKESHVGISPDTVNAVVDALADNNDYLVRALMAPLHSADAADLFECISTDERRQLLGVAHDVLNPDFYSELDETIRDEAVDIIGLDAIAATVSGLDIDDAIDLVEELDAHEREHILAAVSPADRTLIEEGLSYPHDSAGRMMQREVMTVPMSWSVGKTIDYMRDYADQVDTNLSNIFYELVVVNSKRMPVGNIPLSMLLQSKRPIAVIDIMHKEIKLVPVDMDQEEVAFLFRQRDLVSAAVISNDGQLVGTITVDDVVDVIHEEAEDDIFLLGGLQEGDLYAATIDTTKSRFAWLFVNLITAILASAVIGLFQATIEQVVALAVLMPIVASMGGNAGTQTLTVVVRALAMKELTITNAMRQIAKEFLVGGINGVLFAVLMGTVAWLWFSSAELGLVIGLAMTVNMLVAGAAGAAIPIVLERKGIDPALASTVFLTTVTDIVGFLVFLGLGEVFLL